MSDVKTREGALPGHSGERRTHAQTEAPCSQISWTWICLHEVVPLHLHCMTDRQQRFYLKLSKLKILWKQRHLHLGCTGVNKDIIWRPSGKFTVDTQLNSNVGVLRLFPGITDETVENFLHCPAMDGVILETFGSGNAPDRQSLMAIITAATARGVIMINCTQCLRGSVTTAYATGQALAKAGVIAGFDMTPEAALSKLAYVLAKNLTLDKKKAMMICSLRGELTDDTKKPKLSDSRFVQVIAKSLSVKCDEELGAVRDALTPTLVCVAAKTGDIEALEALREMGSDMITADYDGRTPLHVAACEGHVKVVEYLLSKGASVYARDCYGETPLHSAVHCRHKDVVKLLRKTGAHFSPAEMADAGVKLHSLAASGDSEGVEIWQLAGVEQKSTGVARATGRE